jgi:cytochrome c-type biogenesis protein CcmH
LRHVAALVAVLAALAVPTAAASAADCPRTSLAAVEAEVMCPVCGTPLGLATEAPQANRQRALIQRLVDRCRSKEEIKEVLVAQFGEDVLALPEAEGFDLTVYLVPALGLLAAAGGVFLAARRWRRDGGADAEPPAAGLPDDAAASRRLDADLERYEL